MLMMKSAFNKSQLSYWKKKKYLLYDEITRFLRLKFLSGPPVHQLDCVQGAPISLFTSTNAEQMAFPTLFPDGTNGYKTSRDPPLSALNYFQSRLLSEDNRWASHIPYLFWGLNVYEHNV